MLSIELDVFWQLVGELGWVFPSREVPLRRLVQVPFMGQPGEPPALKV